jgi:hypothetical protein
VKTRFDRHVFTQVGLDSGALTMLGVVVHSFAEAGEYRGTVHRGAGPESTFYISVDSASAVAQVTIDLAQGSEGHPAGCKCGAHDGQRYVVHPRGFAVFYVSAGSGGHWVNVRRNDEASELRAYDSRQLEAGDVFAAILLRPGRYSLRNELSEAHGEITVPYPINGKQAERSSSPIDVECGKSIEPSEIRLHPSQGLNVRIVDVARVKIELIEPDDGPSDRGEPERAGWRRQALSQQ